MSDASGVTGGALATPQPSLLPGPAVETIPHAVLGGSALFRAYVGAEPAALAFYRWSPHDPADRARAACVAAQAATARGTRDAVADVLAEQNRTWGASDDVLALVETLRRPDAVAVVTGQQLGLFAGPLYTVYKAQTAVRLAARLADEAGCPAVPVFWLADEDHDVAEIRRAAFVDGEHVRYCTYDDGRPPDADRGPVGRIVLDAAATERALAELEAALPDGPGRADALRLARDAYVPGRTMRDAFAHLLRALVPDIVLMSADDARLKRLAAPVFEREARAWPETLASLEERSRALVDAGFHAQIGPTPVNLFVMGEGARTPLDPDDGGGFVRRGTGEPISTDDLRARIDADPVSISPNVVLRPLVQDTLLPTAAYVAGPGEAAYFAQLGPVYERFGVPMPVIEPRLSLTVVEPGVAKVLDRYGLSVPDLGAGAVDPQQRLHALWRRLALEASDTDLEAAFAQATDAALGAVDALGPVVSEADATLTSTVGSTRRAVEKALDVLATKTIRAEKRTHEIVRARLARAQAALWPDGALQERALGPLGVVARHGLGALAEIVDAVPLDATVHHVVRP
ncbi:bacillithiol biosynthesis cysteine-adding enzyme BshC [Rubrivirga sp.]|uniref:bacillithiol biosynthesis cysteine-adding enzyme BshC n=1 Tax=Rubrivirga sp. TaxID=1885344 RepID=UPI003B527CE5